MDRVFRSVLLVVAIFQVLFAAALVLQIPFITQLWPFPYTGQLSFIFMGSIAFAAAASTLWCLFAGENGSLAGVFLDYTAIFVPLAIYFFTIANGNGDILMLVAAVALGVLFGLVGLWWSLRFPIKDTRRQPMAARIAFAVFIVALIFVGTSLVLQRPNILPWRVSAEVSVIYGFMFLGAAVYFAYALLRPSWANSGGQLAGFLAYDLVLIVPFIAHFGRVEAQLMPNLIIYMVVIVSSALLSAYYLFVNKETRISLSGARSVVESSAAN
jgi:hypothetical protein